MDRAGRGRGRGRSRGQGDAPKKTTSQSQAFAAIARGVPLQERRGGQGMADLVNAERAEDASSSSESNESVVLDDEHIAGEIHSRTREDHDEDEDDDDEDDDDNDDGDDDEVEEEEEDQRGDDERPQRQHKKSKKRARGAPKRKKYSVVHHFFEKGDAAGDFVCKLHGFMPPGSGHPQVVRQGGTGTSNLLSHARTHHAKIVDGLIKAWNEGRDVDAEWKGLVALLAPPERRGIDRWVSVVSRSDALLRKRLALLIFLVANSLSFNVLESPHFELFMSSMGAEFPSRTSLVDLLPSLFTVVLSLLEARFIEAGFFSTTFDLWTSIAGTKYCVITYHTMLPTFELLSAPLDFIPLGCSAFSEFIFHAIETRLSAHPFDALVHVASFTDSGANVQAAKEMLVPNDAESCFNHDLKLVIDDVLAGSDARSPAAPLAALDLNGLALCISFIRASSVLSQEFESTRVQSGCPAVQLLEANLTRWEGRYRMLKRAVQLERALTAFHQRSLFDGCLIQHKHFPGDIFQRSFWRRLREGYEPLLAAFHVASKSAQAKSTPTLSTIPFHLESMRTACKVVDDDPRAVQELKIALYDALESRMSKYVTVVCANDNGSQDIVPNAIKAAILDPRFSSFVQDSLDADKIQSVRDSIIADTVTVMPNLDPDSVPMVEKVMEITFPQLLSALKGANIQDAADVLPWWKNFFSNDAKKHTLCAHFSWSVRIYLSMPAGEAPSEQVLSMATDIVTKKRNRLADQTIEQLLIVSHYTKSPLYNFDELMAKIKEETK
jgi:hypothetical protein